jgi:hypothetical protein
MTASVLFVGAREVRRKKRMMLRGFIWLRIGPLVSKLFNVT